MQQSEGFWTNCCSNSVALELLIVQSGGLHIFCTVTQQGGKWFGNLYPKVVPCLWMLCLPWAPPAMNVNLKAYDSNLWKHVSGHGNMTLTLKPKSPLRSLDSSLHFQYAFSSFWCKQEAKTGRKVFVFDRKCIRVNAAKVTTQQQYPWIFAIVSKQERLCSRWYGSG